MIDLNSEIRFAVGATKRVQTFYVAPVTGLFSQPRSHSTKLYCKAVVRVNLRSEKDQFRSIRIQEKAPSLATRTFDPERGLEALLVVDRFIERSFNRNLNSKVELN